MRTYNVATLLSFMLSLLVQFIYAQDINKSSFSVFTGGMILKNSLLSTSKVGYEIGRFGLIADFTYDDYKERWEDNSESYFQLYGASLSARYYLKPLGRGLFGEASLGIGNPQLTTKSIAIEQKRAEVIPLSGFGLGWRFGRKPKGIFGEAAFRMTYSLKETHLYTTNNPPDKEHLENISYQSWLFEKGKGSGQIYIGVGYSF